MQWIKTHQPGVSHGGEGQARLGRQTELLAAEGRAKVGEKEVEVGDDIGGGGNHEEAAQEEKDLPEREEQVGESEIKFSGDRVEV